MKSVQARAHCSLDHMQVLWLSFVQGRNGAPMKVHETLLYLHMPPIMEGFRGMLHATSGTVGTALKALLLGEKSI